MCIVCAGGLSWLPTGGQQPWSATGSGFSLPGHVGLDGPVGLNADARGGTGPNGRPSLTPTAAGERLTRSNTTWGDAIGQPANITFAFRSTEPGTMPDGTTGFSRFTEVQINATLLALASWSDVANVTFTRVGAGTSGDGAYSNSATMLFGNYNSGAAGAAAFAFFPGSRDAASTSGDMWINISQQANQSGNVFQYGLLTLVHEIGHTLGIDHPADYNAGENQPTYQANANYFEDSYQFTLMSYFSESNTGANFTATDGFTTIYPAAPMMDDIMAAQRLYGANMTTRTGNTVYGFGSNAERPWFSIGSAAQQVVFCVWDAGGIDTFNFSGYSQNQLINLGSGYFSNVGGLVGNVSIAIGATIENAIGGSGNDVINGNAASNVLRGGGGNDSLNGGAGIDTAEYVGVRRQYTANSTSVSGNGEGTDTLISIENARFVDGVLTFDASSASAQVMRLYSATLNRVPDQGGLEFNTGQLSSLGLQGLANTFVASAEFQARFGALNNQQFVEQLFLFALGRAGDAGGIAFWTSQLNAGASRGQIVVGFSESAENVARTAATLNAGLWVPDQQALIIARLYDATFKRLPDVGGLTGWTNALKSGTSVTDIAAAFAGSAEFQATFGPLSNQAFVEQLFRFCLNREGDAGGIAFWVNALNTGTSRASVLLGFSESAEHVALTAPLWSGGIRFAGFVGAATEDAAKDMDAPLVLPDVEVIELELDPADLGLSILDKDADAFVLPALEDLPLPTVDPANPFDGLDLAALRATALNDGRMMLILPETPEATPDFDLDAWTPNQRDGHWLM